MFYEWRFAEGKLAQRSCLGYGYASRALLQD